MFSFGSRFLDDVGGVTKTYVAREHEKTAPFDFLILIITR
jgi:hypothetical protein